MNFASSTSATAWQDVSATYLIAGPPPANPPLPVAVALVALSIAAPFVFLEDGTPSLLLGLAAVAVALAGLLTMAAAIRSQIRRRADAKTRRRVSITRAGITLHPALTAAADLEFGWDNIDNAQLMPSSFVVYAATTAPRPGRYAVRFGKLATSRSDIIAALAAKSGNARELT